MKCYLIPGVAFGSGFGDGSFHMKLKFSYSRHSQIVFHMEAFELEKYSVFLVVDGHTQAAGLY